MARTETATTTSSSGRVTSRWSRVPLWLVIFGTVALAGMLQFASVDWSRPLTIYDEVPHVDYTIRLADGQVTIWDDVYSQRTLGIAECLEQRSPDPQCITATERIPQDRWPNGHSYEAWQGPLGYLPFVAAEVALVNDDADHFSQIRRMRWGNIPLWFAFAGAWTLLILQVTRRRLPAVAASIVVAMNPMLVDRFTYVTNDGTAVLAATAAAAWLLYRLRRSTPGPWWSWLLPALAFGLALGLIKPTALIVVAPIAIAVFVSSRITHRPPASSSWWASVFVMSGVGALTSLIYAAFLDTRSQLTFTEVFSMVLPRGSLDLSSASLLRISDLADIVIGSGARTEPSSFEWGARSPSLLVLAFSLSAACAYFVSLSLRQRSFPRLATVSPRIFGYAVLAGLAAVLIAVPALHFLRGGFLMPFSVSRFLSVLVPLAGLVTLSAFQRFRAWAWVTVVAGFLIAAFGSGPLGLVIVNIRGLLGGG